MTKPDTYHKQLIGADGLDGWQQISWPEFVAARDQRVSGGEWNFFTETHEYWVEGS